MSLAKSSPNHMTGIHNSSVAFFVTLTETLYADIAERIGISNTESRRDIETLRCRVQNEGISFLTKKLPSLGKAVDTALSSGMRLQVPGFEKKPGTEIPKFLGDLLGRIFDDEGSEKSDASPIALSAFRQLVYLLYKLKHEPTPQQVEETCKTFRQVDEALGDSLPELSFLTGRVLSRARAFITRVCGGMCPQDIIPRHGPGAVATGEKFPKKMNFKRIYSKLEAVYPYTEYFVLNLNQVVDEMHEYSDLEVVDSGTAKVVLVPKDSRGPRLISCEPLEYQWIQQGLASAIVSRLESHELTKGHVNFTCQEINRKLALEGSGGAPWVTLDMKDASDRVSLWLVKELFGGTNLLRGLIASRSTHTRLPDGQIIAMKKFAPMGSALCFPVESLVFYALSVAALVVVKQMTWREARDRVFVYGDDLIMHREDYAVALQLLPEFGLMFNSAKCCVAGSFRESCGCDAYRGIDVTPIKLRSIWDRRQKDPSSLASYVAYCNAFYDRGYRRVAEFLECEIQDAFGILPYTPHRNVGYLGFCRPDVHDLCENRKRNFLFRWNEELCRLEILAKAVGSVIKDFRFSSRREMFRRLLSPNKHAEPGQYAVPHRSRLQWGWHPYV